MGIMDILKLIFFLPFAVYNCHVCNSVCLHKFSERLHNLLSTNGDQSLFLILCPSSAAMNFKNFEFGLFQLSRMPACQIS